MRMNVSRLMGSEASSKKRSAEPCVYIIYTILTVQKADQLSDMSQC